jgi:cytochrome P450
MRRYGELIAGVAERQIARWPAGKPFAVAQTMRAIALEVIMRAVFGVDDAARLARLDFALRRLLDATTPPLRVLVLMWAKPDGITMRSWQRTAPTLRRVDALIYDEIRRRRADPRTPEREDILSMLVQARDERGEPMDDRNLRDELMTLLVAGHETTATALGWGLERITRHPEVAERLAAEARADDGDEYVDAVAKEILRVRTVVPFVVRQLARPTTVAGLDLPAGVRVAPCIHLVHRRPDVYPDPDAFRPERFLDRPAGTYTWIPFGGGTRRCLGGAFAIFEMKAVLRTIAASGRVQAAEAGDEPVGRRGLTLVPGRGGRVIWQPAA